MWTKPHSGGCIDTHAAKTLAMEVVVQAVHDYRRLKTYTDDRVKWCGAWTSVSRELERIRCFFTDGGADMYFEMAGVHFHGATIWEQLTEQPLDKKWGSGAFTNRILARYQ